MYSLRNIKKIFKSVYALLKQKFAVPANEESYNRNYLKYQEETLFRKYAYDQGVNVHAYVALEIKMREKLKIVVIKIVLFQAIYVNGLLKRLIDYRKNSCA